MDFHPVAEIFPLITGEAFKALKTDIAANGLHEPLWTWQGKIIDGRNRWRVCEELGITPPLREWEGKGSLVGFVLSLNLHRRHLDASQRAMAAANALPHLEEEAKERMKEGGKKAGRGRPRKAEAGRTEIPHVASTAEFPQLEKEEEATDKGKEFFPYPNSTPSNGEARDHAADLFHTNPRYVSDAKRIKTEAPALAEQVAQGTLTIPQAKKQLPKKPGKGKKKQAWSVHDDMQKIQRLIDKLRPNWQTQRDKDAMIAFFKSTVNEVY